MIKCIAIDDEPLALEQIGEYIMKTSFLHLEGLFESPYRALDYLSDHQVELMYVDINMPDLNGLDFVRTLKNPPKIVFVTAYGEHALDGFRVDAIDYLLKPVSYREFLASANKVRERIKLNPVDQAQQAGPDDFLYVRADYKVLRINFDDIKFIEGMNEYVRIHLVSSKPIMTLVNMKTIENELPPGKFMRVHKSYIVSLTKISLIERNRIVFDGKVYIPVSSQYKEKFQEYLDKHSL